MFHHWALYLGPAQDRTLSIYFSLTCLGEQESANNKVRVCSEQKIDRKLRSRQNHCLHPPYILSHRFNTLKKQVFWQISKFDVLASYEVKPTIN